MMKGAVKFSDLLAEMPKEDLEYIKARAQELKKAEHLYQLREFAQKKQAEIAGMTQVGVSRLESRDDWLVSSINTYVRGLGGTLKIVAELPGIGTVELPINKNGKLAGKAAKTKNGTQKKLAESH